MRSFGAPAFVAGLALLGASLVAQGTANPTRVFASASGAFSTFDAMVADLAKADFVFIGEEHDDVRTHQVELALLQQIAARREGVILALEMFERDAQDPLDHLQMGHLEEAEFARDARAWPNYARDYKPLVDFAIAKKWPVIAANAPTSIVARVVEGGLGALDGLTATERPLVAGERRCPTDDAYYRRFVAAMKNGHADAASPAVGPAVASADRLYLAQCLKDETMAESVAQIYVAGTVGGKQPLVILLNGAFHSDYRQGVVDRTLRRLPEKRAAVVSIIPVDTLDRVPPADKGRADYLIYSRK